MTLPSCLRSSIDHGFHDRLRWVLEGQLENTLKTLLQLRAFRCKCLTERWMGCSPSYFHPPSLFSCEGIHLYRSARREVEEGARGCARVCVRAWRPSGSVFAFFSSSSHRVSGRRGSLSGSLGRPPTALTAGARRPPSSPSSPPSSAPAPARSLLLSCAPSRPLSGRALPLAPDPASQLPGRAGGAPRCEQTQRAPGARGWGRVPAHRGVGCDWRRSPCRGGPSGCRAGASSLPRARSCAHWVPKSPRASGSRAHVLSDAHARVPGVWRRGEGSEAPGECVCLRGAGEAPLGRCAPLLCAFGSRTNQWAESGRGCPCGVSLGVPKLLRVAVRCGSARQDRLVDGGGGVWPGKPVLTDTRCDTRSSSWG